MCRVYLPAMRIAWPKPSLATHLLVFIFGAVIATATMAQAVPGASSRAELRRYQTLDSFAQALSHITKGHVDVIDERKLVYGAIVGMVGELDAHSAFYTPGQYTRLRQDTEGEFGGIGVQLGDANKGVLYPLVESVVPGSPAERAGLRVKDGLISVNGKATVVDGATRAVAHAWHSRLRGAAGSRVSITLMRAGWKTPRKFTLLRERVAIPSVVSTRYGQVAHIAIRRFREATTRDLRKAIEEALRVPNTRLILDLRGNPGGLLDKGISVADAFLSKGRIVSVVSRGGQRTEVAKAHKEQTYTGFPMVVLVDQNSASASEIVAAALQENGRAKILGVPTYGKGSVQTFLDLADGSGLKLTTSRYLTPSGKTLEGAGIEPDFLVEAFDAMVVSPSGKAPQAKKVPRIKGLNKTQQDNLLSDPQLLAGFQLVSSI